MRTWKYKKQVEDGENRKLEKVYWKEIKKSIKKGEAKDE